VPSSWHRSTASSLNWSRPTPGSPARIRAQWTEPLRTPRGCRRRHVASENRALTSSVKPPPKAAPTRSR
jgi:hypothetical protein